jgi:hypothetical protein
MKDLEIAKAVKRSANHKTGPVAVTYTPVYSCPKICPFLNNGCYAQSGNCAWTVNSLNQNATISKKTRPVDIAVAEAEAIRQLPGDKPLRLHVFGDCRTPLAAEIVAAACHEYKQIDNQPVWTYTHAWRTIPRSKWGGISVLASCENLEEAAHASARGYAVCLVRKKQFNRLFYYKGFNMTPCKEMTAGIQCNKCKLCFDDARLRKYNKAICFFPHGARSRRVEEAIFYKKNYDPAFRRGNHGV